MTQEEMKQQLLDSQNAEGNFDDYDARHPHAKICKEVLPLWDTQTCPWDHDSVVKYIRMDKWCAFDFSLAMEQIVMQYLPKYMHEVFQVMKLFKSNSRSEMISTVEDYARLEAWPRDTYEDKARCTYLFHVLQCME